MAKRHHEGKGPTQRQLRVSELVRRKLAELAGQGAFKIADLPSDSITVSEVRLSPDLKKATVYVLPLGGRHGEETVSVLNRDRAEIRRQLNRQIDLKYSPQLNFVLDRTFDQMDQMRQLFERDDIRRDLDKPVAPTENR